MRTYTTYLLVWCLAVNILITPVSNVVRWLSRHHTLRPFQMLCGGLWGTINLTRVWHGSSTPWRIPRKKESARVTTLTYAKGGHGHITQNTHIFFFGDAFLFW